MKKLLSVFCCILYMRCIGQAPADIVVSSPRTAGEKVLVKAITSIVNREGNRKERFRKINLSSFEYP